MTLPVSVQTLVSQIVQELGLQALRPSSLEINLSKDGLVQDVKPVLRFTREKT